MLENNHTIHLTLNGESRAFTVEPRETLHHFQAVVGALLRIYIKHFPLFLGQFSRIS